MTRISVITPTWRRGITLLGRCVPSVRAQTWPDVEHVIVSDGPDPDLAADLAGQPVVFDQLDSHVDGTVDYGSRARNRALQLATGDLIAYLDDDNAFRPQHLATLAGALLANPDVDFAYSQMLTTAGNVIGAARPQYGGIDTSIIMHRAGLPERAGGWPLPEDLAFDPHAPDWGAVSRWLLAGARWIHVPEITVDYWS